MIIGNYCRVTKILAQELLIINSKILAQDIKYFD